MNNELIEFIVKTFFSWDDEKCKRYLQYREVERSYNGLQKRDSFTGWALVSQAEELDTDGDFEDFELYAMETAFHVINEMYEKGYNFCMGKVSKEWQLYFYHKNYKDTIKVKVGEGIVGMVYAAAYDALVKGDNTNPII